MPQKLLKVIEVNDEVFYKILEAYECKVEIKKDLYPYYNGYYNDKDTIYFNGENEFICKEYIVNYYCDKIAGCTSWKQIRVQKNINMQTAYVDSLTGSRAKAYVNKILKRFYTEKEIDERLRMFEADYNADLKQMQYRYKLEMGQLIKISNTYKFDVNGAHLDALCEIFPKAHKPLHSMYERRKKNPIFKKYPNLYVGMLAQKSKDMRKNHVQGKYEKTYNWIVQRTTKKLLEAMEYLGGQLIYANTDGLLVKSPNHLLKTSKELGDFKLEYSGDTYVYRDKNYLLYQTGDNMFGSCFTEVRKMIDLRKGDVVHYDIETTEKYRKPVNIEKENVRIYEN